MCVTAFLVFLQSSQKVPGFSVIFPYSQYFLKVVFFFLLALPMAATDLFIV